MTRFPLLSTVFAIAPLAALAWPLAQVIQPQLKKEVTPDIIEASPIRRADIEVRSAHSFESCKITIGDASWDLTTEEPYGEIHFPLPESKELTVLVEVVWAAETPETALLFEIIPDNLTMRSHTLWGQKSATEELNFKWP